LCNIYKQTFDKLGRNLFECLQARKYKPLSLAATQSISRQLLKAVSFLHDCLGLVHTDLKPENILLVESDLNRSSTPSAKTSHERLNNSRSTSSKSCSSSTASTYPRIKLIDFGSATFADHFHSFLVSTRHYRSPEVILHLGWSFPCDIWSVGCIIFELLTGSSLFQTHDDLEHLAMIERVVGPIPQRMASRACGLKRGDTERRTESRVKKRKRRRWEDQSVDAKQERERDQRKEGNNTREERNRQHGSLKKDHPYDDPYDYGHDDEWDDAGEESEDKNKDKNERSFSDEDDSDEDFPAATFFKESKGAEQPRTEAKAAAVCIRSVDQGVRQSQSTGDELNRRSVEREGKRRRYKSPDSFPPTLKGTSSPALVLRWPTESTTAASLKAVARLSPLLLELRKNCRSDLVDLATAVDFLSRLLELDPNRRITASAALRHPFLTEKLDPIRRGEEGGRRSERNEASWQYREIKGRGRRTVNGWRIAGRDEQINDLGRRDQRFDEKQRHFGGRDRGFDGGGRNWDENSRYFDDRKRKRYEKSSSDGHRSLKQWRGGGRTAQEEGR